MMLVLPLLYAGSFGILLVSAELRGACRDPAVHRRALAAGRRLSRMGDADERRARCATRSGPDVPERRTRAGRDRDRGDHRARRPRRVDPAAGSSPQSGSRPPRSRCSSRGAYARRTPPRSSRRCARRGRRCSPTSRWPGSRSRSRPTPRRWAACSSRWTTGSPGVRRLSAQLLTKDEQCRGTSALERALRDERSACPVRTHSPRRPGRQPQQVEIPKRSCRCSTIPTRRWPSRPRRPSRRDRTRPPPHPCCYDSAAAPDPDVRSTALRHLAAAPPDAAAGLATPALGKADRGSRRPDRRADDPRRGAARRGARTGGPRVRGPEPEGAPGRDGRGRAARRWFGGRGARRAGPAGRPDAAPRSLSRTGLGGQAERVRTFVAERSRDRRRRRARCRGAVRRRRRPTAEGTLVDRARANGRSALRALSLISSDGAAVLSAVESLDARDPAQVANALETLEATTDATLAAPILALWEPSADRDGTCRPIGSNGCRRTMMCSSRRAPGPWSRNVTERDAMARTDASMPDRTRAVPAACPAVRRAVARGPGAIAEVAQERSFADGELLASEGELGDELLIVASGIGPRGDRRRRDRAPRPGRGRRRDVPDHARPTDGLARGRRRRPRDPHRASRVREHIPPPRHRDRRDAGARAAARGGLAIATRAERLMPRRRAAAVRAPEASARAGRDRLRTGAAITIAPRPAIAASTQTRPPTIGISPIPRTIPHPTRKAANREPGGLTSRLRARARPRRTRPCTAGRARAAGTGRADRDHHDEQQHRGEREQEEDRGSEPKQGAHPRRNASASGRVDAGERTGGRPAQG